jgi:hypothetical protein
MLQGNATAEESVLLDYVRREIIFVSASAHTEVQIALG